MAVKKHDEHPPKAAAHPPPLPPVPPKPPEPGEDLSYMSQSARETLSAEQKAGREAVANVARGKPAVDPAQKAGEAP